MVVRGHVKNGVVVLDGDVRLPEGEEVTVVAPAQPPLQTKDEVSEERRKAALDLIGMWKTDNPPSDEEVEQIIDEARMKKYG